MEDFSLSPDDELVLGGVLRFATRFDGLDAETRKGVLAAAGDELGYLATETRRVGNERGGYRDAAVVVQVIATGLDRLLARAREAFASDTELRAAILALDRRPAQVAIVHAVETLARHGGVTRTEELFLDWLRSSWRIPRASDED